MDRVDRLFGTSCGQDFFSLLRSWHDKRAQLSFRSWRRFQIGLVSSTESTLFLRNVNQSPFNVGLHIDVGDFTLDEVKVLNQRYGEPMEPAQVAALYELLAGHPTLTSRSLELVNSNQSFHTLQCFNALLMEAHHEGGPFGEHLARMWEMLQVVPELLEAVRSALLGKPCPEQAFLRLRSAGVLSGPSSDRAKVRCLLYARYLESKILP